MFLKGTDYNMIHEINPMRFNNAFKQKPPSEKDCFLYYESNKLLLQRSEEGLAFPRFRLLSTDLWQYAEYMFSIDDEAFYLLQTEFDSTAEPFELYPVRQFREFDPRWMAFAGITGWQLSRWKETHRFCGRCGERAAASANERAIVCPACGLIEYPKISPAVIVAVMDGDRLLMINSKNAPVDRYHLVAGFVEIGETLEQAVAREVREEAGINIKNIRYYKNQPWSISDTIMVGFIAELDGDDALTPQESEINDAKWFHRTEMPLNQTTASIGSEMTNSFRAGILKEI